MNRRTFLQTAAAAPALLGQTAAKPNVIFILADDLGYGIPGCYGQKEIQTPNLDALAAGGMRFTQGYSGATVCAPSRCVLMTGKHTGHANVRGNGAPEQGPAKGETTLPQVFKAAGYETAIFGKWGLGAPDIQSSPLDLGFDHFLGYLTQTHAHNYYPEHLWEGRRETLLRDNWFNQRKIYTPDLFLDRAQSFVSKKRNQPFFLYFPSLIPHTNNERGTLTGNGQDVPTDAPYSDKPWPQVERNFAAAVTRLDQHVGQIVRLLKETGQYENTLIFFTSDNGPHKEGGHSPAFFRDSGPLRGIKRDLYEGGVRVPFLAHWPARIRPGQVSDQVATFWDMIPTVADLTGVRRPANLDGISLLPALTGEGKIEDRGLLYWEFHEGGFKRSVRLGNWKGVKLAPSQPMELYDLAADLSETKNIAAAHPAVVEDLEKRMAAARTMNERWPGRTS